MVKHFVLSYFAGCGGFSLGAKAAGCDTLGVEFDNQIAQLYRNNVGECLTADVTKLDPHKLEIPGVSDRRNSGSLLIWQLSPECKKFSRANTAVKNNPETAMATDSATSINKIWWHEEVLQPDAIILENVEDYAKYDGYDNFRKYLLSKDYRILQLVLNAADFGDATSRRRLIMIATRPYLLTPQIKTTHSETMAGQLDLFGDAKLPWIGWHEAIKDLLPLLPMCSLTDKQLEAVKALGITTQLIDGTNSNSVKYGHKTRAANRPSFTLSCKAHAKALLVERVGYYKSAKTAAIDEPCWTLRAHLGSDGKDEDGTKEPGNRNKIINAVIGAEVRSITPEALARFHSFPRSYKWSGRASLDVKAIGNSIPLRMSQAIVESVIGGAQ